MADAYAVFARLAILLQTCYCVALVGAKCTIDLNKDATAGSPLFLSMSALEPIYPDRRSPRYLSFDSGQKQLLYCPGGELTRFNRTTNSSTEISKCQEGKSFLSVPYRLNYSFEEIGCSASPSPVTRSDPKYKCLADDSGVLVEIGYRVKDSGFWKTIELCHSRNRSTTGWARATVLGVIGGNKPVKDATTPAFSKGQFFENVVMSQVYPRNHQVKTFTEIFKEDKPVVDRYLPQDGPKRNYLVRGHLVARADQLYYAEQYSTYFYVNVLPMWQSVNNGNWKSVESTVRRTASVVGDLEVYTGGLGVLRLSGREIYLSRDRRNASRPMVPVPRLLFKLVYSQSRHEALVFLTVNDPHVDDAELPSYRICRQEHQSCRSSQFDKRFEGFTYCCAYEDFAANNQVKSLALPLQLRNVAPLSLH